MPQKEKVSESKGIIVNASLWLLTVNGVYHGPFWFFVGGKIEEGESMQQAALRELHEETGLTAKEVEPGPVVWYGTFDLILSGTLQRLKK